MEFLRSAGVGAYFRPRDVEALGLSFPELQSRVRDGTVEKVGRGLYRLADPEVSVHETLAMVAAAIPHGIVCLLSALLFHDVGTQLPHRVWIALDRKARRPADPPVEVRFVRFSGAMLRYGVQEHEIQGVPVRVTSPARTVVDCFRYRNTVGLDVALEALGDALRSRKATVDEIVRAAKVCRIWTVLKPYLEAIHW